MFRFEIFIILYVFIEYCSFSVRCVASQYPGSCISANSIRISALVNIAAFLALQTVVLLQNYFSEEHSDPHFMIIMSRIRIDEELVNNVAVSDNTSTNTNIFDKVKSSLITPSPEEKSRDANIHPSIHVGT